MARPKGRKRFPVNLTLPSETKRAAARLALRNNESLSQLITRLLEERIAAESAERRAA